MALTGNIANYSPTYYDVMMYLHSIPISKEVKENVGRRLVKEVTEPALAKAYAKIDELSQLKENWAGDGSLPISQNVLNNIKRVLLISDDKDWNEWMIGPDVNATIGLQSKTHRALMSLGAKEFSYFVRIDREKMAASHVDFSPEVFLETMRKIA